MQSKRIVSTAIWLVILASPALGAAWHVMKVENGNFSVEFSGETTIEDPPISDDVKQGTVSSKLYIQDSGNFAYLVGATELKGDVHFDAGVTKTMGSYQCSSTESDQSAVLENGTRVREIRASGCAKGLQAAGRFFQRGQWFYQVIYLGTDEVTPDHEHFLQSFHLL